MRLVLCLVVLGLVAISLAQECPDDFLPKFAEVKKQCKEKLGIPHGNKPNGGPHSSPQGPTIGQMAPSGGELAPAGSDHTWNQNNQDWAKNEHLALPKGDQTPTRGDKAPAKDTGGLARPRDAMATTKSDQSTDGDSIAPPIKAQIQVGRLRASVPLVRTIRQITIDVEVEGPNNPGQGPKKPGQGPKKPGQGPKKPGQGPKKPGQGPKKLGQGPKKQGHGLSEEERKELQECVDGVMMENDFYKSTKEGCDVNPEFDKNGEQASPQKCLGLRLEEACPVKQNKGNNGRFQRAVAVSNTTLMAMNSTNFSNTTNLTTTLAP